MSDEHATDTDLTDPYVPVDSDNQPLQWLDGNRAKIPGLIHETMLHYQRNGLFEALLEHGAVILSGGRIAIPSKTTIPFIQGDISDPEPYTLKKRIPSASERVDIYADGPA